MGRHTFKGLRDRIITIRLVTLFAANFAQRVPSAGITESSFACPSSGRLLVESVFARDCSLVRTVVCFASAMLAGIYLLVKPSYAWLGQRFRLSSFCGMEVLVRRGNMRPADGLFAPRQPLGHGCLRCENGSRNFCGAEPAPCLEREDDLHFLRNKSFPLSIDASSAARRRAFDGIDLCG
jgi:hypothetical protein